MTAPPRLPLGDRRILQEAADKGSLVAATRIGGLINPDAQQRLRELMVLASCGYLYKFGAGPGGMPGGPPGDWLHVYKLTPDGQAALQNH